MRGVWSVGIGLKLSYNWKERFDRKYLLWTGGATICGKESCTGTGGDTYFGAQSHPGVLAVLLLFKVDWTFAVPLCVADGGLECPHATSLQPKVHRTTKSDNGQDRANNFILLIHVVAELEGEISVKLVYFLLAATPQRTYI